MIDLFKGMFRRESSGQTAKDRLRLVLMSDHLALAPEIVAAMKAELLAVIARYVEFDPAHADVSFESRESDVAMLASIPILSVRERPGTPPPPAPNGGGGTLASGGGNAAQPPREPARFAANANARAATGLGERPRADDPSAAREPAAADLAADATVAVDAVVAATAAKPRTPRRRRRKSRVKVAPLPA